MANPNRPSPLKPNASNHINQVREWTSKETMEWLSSANDGLFAQYAENVLTLKINGADLMNLTTNDMKQKLGITSSNHITTLSAAIDRLKKKSKRRKNMKSPPSNIKLDNILDITLISSPTVSLNDSNKKKKTKSKNIGHIVKAQSMYNVDTKSLNKPINSKSLKNNPSLNRTYTIQSEKKQNEIQLKRTLTEKNVGKKNPNKYLYKDLGKKLWPKETSSILKEGWMKKRGVRRSGFKERWCVLRENGHLYYFQERPTKNDLPQGMLDLAHALKVEYVKDEDPNTFNITTKDRNWIFSAMTGGELVEWLSRLNNSMKQFNK